jgi:hypothetical protein
LVNPTRCVCLEDAPNFIPNSPEHCELLLLGSRGMRGIIEREMMPIPLAWEHRTRLVCLAANGDHRIDRLIQEFAQMLRAMLADIDANLTHHLDGERVNVSGRLRPRTDDPKTVASHSSKDSLRQMTPAGVASTENQDKGRVGHDESEHTEFLCRQGKFARAESAM